ncbi:unnamed protein product [Larinioides sclopetarius]|uniref:DUF19 domain-containing protein n=1 Tax=Larinioides sclopetarius TaxID=280406 RepID=A0AAV2C0L9_9ARAC
MLSTFVRCLKDFQDKCDPESSHIFASEEEYNGMYGVFSEVCEEGTFLNRIATENLRCFNQTFQTTSCPEKMKAITGPYRSPRVNTEDEDDYTLPIDIMCLQDILESNCIAADIGKNCGKEALEATMEFFRRTFYIQETCGKRNAETLLRGVDAFNLDQEQKAIVIATLESVIISAKE